MSKVTVTFEFENAYAAHAFLAKNGGESAIDKIIREQNGTAQASGVAQENPQSAAPQPAPAPQSGAATATATVAQCAEAFQRHVKKGGGRSAMTARKAVTDALPNFQNFQALTPEECATAVAAMDRATDAA